MTSRERLQRTLNHQSVDRLCVDFGATGQTGIAAVALDKLRGAVLGSDGQRVKVIEPYQMLGEVDGPLRRALGVDVAGVVAPKTMFGFDNTGWKRLRLFCGTEVLVPERFNVTDDGAGGWYMYPEGDTSAAPCARMPKGGHFFDALNRQAPLDEAMLDPADNCEEFGLLSASDIEHFRWEAERLREAGDCGVAMSIPGTAFGDIALVPATWMRQPKGIRDVEEWYVSILTRRDYVYKVFEHQCAVALENIERLAEALGEAVQVAVVSGTDFGTQRGPFVSPKVYRELYKPFQKQVNDLIHRKTNWKVFIHSCGSVYELMPDFIEAGFDILNPVQCSAEGMEPRRLKREFGQEVVFWGGGVDTQKTLPFGTPQEVYREVRERIDILGEGGGYVFSSIHNVQANVPLENMLAMFAALRDASVPERPRRSVEAILGGASPKQRKIKTQPSTGKNV